MYQWSSCQWHHIDVDIDVSMILMSMTKHLAHRSLNPSWRNTWQAWPPTDLTITHNSASLSHRAAYINAVISVFPIASFITRDVSLEFPLFKHTDSYLSWCDWVESRLFISPILLPGFSCRCWRSQWKKGNVSIWRPGDPLRDFGFVTFFIVSQGLTLQTALHHCYTAKVHTTIYLKIRLEIHL